MKGEKLLKSQQSRLHRTETRRHYLQQQGYNVREVWECDFEDLARENETLHNVITRSQPKFFRRNKGPVSEANILEAVKEEQLFGMIEVDITVSTLHYR